MKTAIIPQVRIEPQLRADLDAVLRDGETLSEFVESTVRGAVEHRLGCQRPRQRRRSTRGRAREFVLLFLKRSRQLVLARCARSHDVLASGCDAASLSLEQKNKSRVSHSHHAGVGCNPHSNAPLSLAR